MIFEIKFTYQSSMHDIKLPHLPVETIRKTVKLTILRYYIEVVQLPIITIESRL